MNDTMREQLQASHPDLRKAVRELTSHRSSCVLCRGEETIESFSHGVRPLMEWIAQGRDFTGFCAADQVIGRAAALLYAKLGVRSLYGCLLSEKAVPVLEKFHMTYLAEKKVPFIENRTGDDLCPMERSVLDVTDPDEAVEKLRLTITSMKNRR